MEGEGEAHSPPAELEAEHSLADPTYDQGDVSHDQGDVSAVEEIPAEVPSGEAPAETAPEENKPAQEGAEAPQEAAPADGEPPAADADAAGVEESREEAAPEVSGAGEPPQEQELVGGVEQERLTSAVAAGPIEPEPELTPLEATAAFRDKYLESCSMYGCDPVPLLLQVIDISLEHGEPLTAVVLNGNSKHLFNKRLTLKQVHALANALQSSRIITELHLCYNFLDDRAAQAISELLKVNRSIATVALDGNDIGPEGAKYLADALANQQSGDDGLTSLKLNHNPLEDKGGLCIAGMLRTNSKLKHLFISGTHMGMPSVVGVAAALQESNTTLEILDISNNLAHSYHDDPAISFSKVLARHPALWALSLSKWRMGDYGLENLVTASHAALENQALRYLDLSCNRLTEVSGKVIARLIAANTPLETLRLGCNELHDNAAYEVANALMDNETLVELDLSFNGLTDGALSDLAQGVRHARSLSSIKLWGNDFGPSSAEAWGYLLREREENNDPLHCDFRVFVVDGISYVAKVTEDNVQP